MQAADRSRAMINRTWQLAWPLILSSVSVPMLGIVDTAVMGHMPDAAYLGAVAVGALIFDFVYWAFGFLRMGTTGFTAQAFGANDTEGLRLALARPLLIGVAIGFAIYALQWPIGRAAFSLIDAGPEVAPLSEAYYAVRIWAAPVVLANYAVLGWIIGVQRPKLALLTQLVANLLNVALDLFFVLGLGWGVEGVALGSVLAQMGGLIAGLIVVRRVQGPILRGLSWSAIVDRAALGRLWGVNRDIFIRTLGLMTAFGWFTAQGADQGKVLLAANAVLFNLQLVMSYALDGFAHAAEVLVGEALGRSQRDSDQPNTIRQAIRATMTFSAIIALAFALIWAIFGGLIIDGLTDLPAIRAAARTYLPWAIGMPLVSVWCFQLDGVCIGAMRTQAMRDGMLVALVGFVGVGFAAIRLWGNHGLWAAFMLFFALRAVTLWPTLRRLTRPAATPV